MARGLVAVVEAGAPGVEKNGTQPGREDELKTEAQAPGPDTITGPATRGPNKLESQALGLESGPALFSLPRAGSRIFRSDAHRAPRPARSVHLPRGGGGRSPGSAEAVGAGGFRPLLPPRARAPVPRILPGSENKEEGLDKPGRAAEGDAGEANRYYVPATTVGLPY